MISGFVFTSQSQNKLKTQMKIVIAPYNPNWPTLYEQERSRLMEAVGVWISSIQHIGSTSVRGLGAKPIIDIMIGVRTLAEADTECIQPITSLGYEYVKEFEMETPQRRYFRKSNSDGIRTHHIHLVEINSDWWANHLLFRDYLRASPHERDAYERHKRGLAEREWESGNHYADAKSGFILGVLEEARAWKQSVCC